MNSDPPALRGDPVREIQWPPLCRRPQCPNLLSEVGVLPSGFG